MRHVVTDANVFVSFFIARNDRQRLAAKSLFLKAEAGDLVAVVPQFVLFEIVYVLQNFYSVSNTKVSSMVRDIVAMPGLLVTDHCPWSLILQHWPDPFRSIADAAIVSVAVVNRFDNVATFDDKLSKRLQDFGLGSYW